MADLPEEADDSLLSEGAPACPRAADGPGGMGQAADVSDPWSGDPVGFEPWPLGLDAVGPANCEGFPIQALLAPACMTEGCKGAAECLDATGVGPLLPTPGICSFPPNWRPS